MDAAWSVDQADLERRVELEAAEALKSHENELDEKRLTKTRQKIDDINAKIAVLTDKIESPATRISEREKARESIFKLQRTDLKSLRRDESDILARIADRSQVKPEADSGSGRLPDETEQEFLVRTGKITPFGKPTQTEEDQDRSHRDLSRPSTMLQREVKRRRIEDPQPELDSDATDDEAPVLIRRTPESDEEDEEFKYEEDDDEEEEPSQQSSQDQDDGNILHFHHRVNQWVRMRKTLRKELKKDKDLDETKEEWELPHPEYPDKVIDPNAGFAIPGDIWASLFAYQKTGVRWLWELYNQRTGGIIGDEMGLGKTVQVAAFLAGLHYSGMLKKRPALIVCPATVMSQWVTELHQWWPPLRVAILHSMGTGMVNGGSRAASFDTDSEDESALANSQVAGKALLKGMFETGHVVVTTYAGLKVYSKFILPKVWGYCCLDEGHKIRNPNSEVSLNCKQIKTHYRLILSGTPIQNNLVELWSLFDFVFPGRLGTLPVFQNQFSIPINVGGYANATNIQVQTAYKCAVVLRNLIAPYLLRRMKSDVATDLPQKTEKVLFCKLTKPQREAYTLFLKSDEMNSIMSGRRQVLYGVDILRKICNHPDLLTREISSHRAGYGDPTKSGKMQVVKALLELWTSQGHRTLLFTQTRQMLDILEPFVGRMNMSYLRMDGSTQISQRQNLVSSFNNDSQYKVFLLTTKVGGLGVNLTGADRIIIYDPDWNPSTDVQARERAWRLGQKKEVVIYRLMIAGSIEEKIYHRQIFKQFLTNKILKDPKQKRFFKNTDLNDLFSLGDSSETGDLFAGTETKVAKARDAPSGDDDIRELSGISRQDNFKTGETAKSGDDGLLEGLFAKAGVHSTLEHDAVMDASRPDTVLMEREATRIANQAAAALKESRREARKHKIGTPTWTGRFGKAGRAPVIGKANSVSPSPPASSASILEALKSKRELETKTTTSASMLPASVIQSHTEAITRIRNFLATRPNFAAKSAEIVKACDIKLDSDQAVANLRHMLKKVATWDSTSGSWHLQYEFQADK